MISGVSIQQALSQRLVIELTLLTYIWIDGPIDLTLTSLRWIKRKIFKNTVYAYVFLYNLLCYKIIEICSINEDNVTLYNNAGWLNNMSAVHLSYIV